MHVLVTGGSGFVGRALVGALQKRGDRVTVVSRKPGPGAVGWDTVEREIETADAIVHLAGEPVADGRWTDARIREIRDSRVQSTERIAAAVARSERKPSVLVSGSAVGFYGMREDNRELDEEAPAGDGVLARIVVDWERAADPARDAGVRVVHPRFGIVLGLGGGALAKMVTPFRFFVGGPLGSGSQWMSWIHLHDTVRALLFAIERESLAGPVNIVSPNPVRMDALSAAMAAALHRPAAFRLPSLALHLVLGRGLADTLLTGQRALPRKLLAAGFAFDFPRIDGACSDLLAAKT